MRKVLSRQEVIDAVERRGCKNPPAFLHKFWGMGLQEKYGEQLNKLADLYPDDICSIFYTEPGYDVSPTQNPEYRFGFKDYRNAERHSIGESAVLLDDWSELDQFLHIFRTLPSRETLMWYKRRQRRRMAVISWAASGDCSMNGSGLSGEWKT